MPCRSAGESSGCRTPPHGASLALRVPRSDGYAPFEQQTGDLEPPVDRRDVEERPPLPVDGLERLLEERTQRGEVATRDHALRCTAEVVRDGAVGGTRRDARGRAARCVVAACDQGRKGAGAAEEARCGGSPARSLRPIAGGPRSRSLPESSVPEPTPHPASLGRKPEVRLHRDALHDRPFA
jgi:hypothetical protein